MARAVVLGAALVALGVQGCSSPAGGGEQGGEGGAQGQAGEQGQGGDAQGGTTSHGGSPGQAGETGTGGDNQGGMSEEGGAGGVPAPQGGSPQGGAGGSATGGTRAGGTGGGAAGSGGGAGSGGSSVPSFEPSCTYRHICGTQRATNMCGAGDDPRYVNCGPNHGTTRAERPVRAGAPAFCNARNYAKDGIHRLPNQNTLDSAARAGNRAGSYRGNLDLGAVIRDVYEPPGYANAEMGKVGILFLMDAFNPRNTTFKVEEQLDYLIGRGEIPYTLAVFLNVGNDGGVAPNVIRNIKGAVLPRLQTRYPKLATDPAYRAIIGQSTAGAAAFDVMWMGTDVVGGGIGGSPSFACFMCLGAVGRADADGNGDINDTYQNWIRACPVKPIRWTATVGTCDIFGTCQQRMAAGCPGCARGGEVDASDCGATWLNTSRAVTQAMMQKGMPVQLFEVAGGGHTPTVWGGIALADQLRWVFRDLVCF